MRRTATLLFSLLVLLFTVLGCGGSGGSGMGTFKVFLSDAPTTGVTAVNVTVDSIQAHIDGQWVDVANTPQTYDLLSLTREPAIAGTIDGLPSGSVTQVRFFVSSVTVTDGTGTHDAIVPSAAQTGIKVNLDTTIAPGAVTAVLIDFNVAKSLVQQGNGAYLMQPVLVGAPVDLAATASGTVTLNGNPVEGATVKAIYKSGLYYPADTEVNTSTTAADGTFKVWALLPGTYDFEVTYTDSTPTDYAGSVTGVEVTRGTDVALGEITLTAVP
ncbi:MAG TPA: DUF4382 domain-containing protein [Fimbriimonadaceae bacterium]|nr:DUF4382 domain-containing protein [Fimbriimonadaceae bacterium]